MAKATPVTAAPEAGAPAPAAEIKMPPADQKPAKVDRSELEALADEARAEGKAAVIIGNAVRVDH